MGQLIAIILAVILGAFAAILQIVNLGSGYANKSADVVAQHFLQHATTLESAMAVYGAEEAKSSYKAAATGTALEETIAELATKDLVKEVPVSVVNGVTFDLAQDGGKTFMQASGVSAEVCTAFSELKGSKLIDASTATPALSDMGTARYACVQGSGGETPFLAYRVE